MLDDSTGSYKPAYVNLLSEFTATAEDFYLAVIHRRTPYLGGGLPFAHYAFHQRVPPLDDSEAKLLLQQLCRRFNLKLDPPSANEIVDYLGGHPPSVYFTASFAQTYGIANLIADKSTLVDFKAKIFTRFIADLRLSDLDWLVLRYLSSEKTIPLAAISTALEKPTDDIALSLRTLIDHCLLVLVDDNYGVASPIRDAVFRVKGHLEIDDYKKVCANLTKAFWSDENAGPSIEVIDATLHAVARTGSTDFKPYENLVRPSIVHRLAKECYHRKEWAEAIEYARRAETMDPKRKEPRQIHFKALVQLGRWDEAAAKLTEIEKTRDRTHFYLKGFLLKKKEQPKEAIQAFESAIKSGDRGNAVYRDYADCLYRCDRFDEAIKSINEVLRRDPENVFVLDLVARICIDGGFKDLLTETLQKLERYDIDKRFVYHRKATHYSALGAWEAALAEAEQACETGHSPFEAFATKIDCQIHLQRFPEAEATLGQVEERFKSHRRDVQLGLRCKLLIRRGQWKEAKVVWDQLQNKTKSVHRALLLRILDLKSKDSSVPLLERQQAEAESKTLSGELTSSGATIRSLATDLSEAEDAPVD